MKDDVDVRWKEAAMKEQEYRFRTEEVKARVAESANVAARIWGPVLLKITAIGALTWVVSLLIVRIT